MSLTTDVPDPMVHSLMPTWQWDPRHPEVVHSCAVRRTAPWGDLLGGHSLNLLGASGKFAAARRLTAAKYVRRAIERTYRDTRVQLPAERVSEGSRRTRGEGMRVNAEFAAVERDLDAA